MTDELSPRVRRLQLRGSGGKARAIRFATLDAICEALGCQPGDILRFEAESVQTKKPKAS